ncbi:hypothetical protein ElyMa_006690100 [Elysia marginata]|uniref:Thyroglobulin type-1 domain-containing protein n=1 Tax=Elysia marginata TaxID=1093978 RepID=A0AAV4IQX8_9GAST|nr:hypothetical protein ElyMa_006690100 [Elysia marginata]
MNCIILIYLVNLLRNDPPPSTDCGYFLSGGSCWCWSTELPRDNHVKPHRWSGKQAVTYYYGRCQFEVVTLVLDCERVSGTLSTSNCYTQRYITGTYQGEDTR